MTDSPNQQSVKKRSLTDQEKSSIALFKGKPESPPVKIFRAAKKGENNTVTIELSLDPALDHNDALSLLSSSIASATGSSNSTVGLQLLTNLAKAIISPKVTTEETVNQMDTISQIMNSLSPQDEYEGQLIAQLLILHEHSMEWLGKAMRTERVDFANTYLNGASKLLTRHHETLETLLKYRRRGEQRVVVEHVHIHSGGQAIVGTINPGVGVNQESKEAPHAKV